MVGVSIFFNRLGQEWKHEFQIDVGQTILKLKEVMLARDTFSVQDLNSFELQREGQRVPDYERIQDSATFMWKWLGPEVGSAMAAKDAEQREVQEKIARERQEDDRKRQAQRAAQEAAHRVELLQPPEKISITVKHALEEMASEITVHVMSNDSVRELRSAVMSKLGAIGDSDDSSIRFVQRRGTVFSSIDDYEKIGKRREFLSLGRKLAVEEAMVEVTVRHAMEEHASQISVQVLNSGTYYDVKRAVMRALGENKESQVKIVAKIGSVFSAVDNSQKIGHRREFFSIGRKLEVEETAEKKMWLTLTDEEGHTLRLEMPRASSVGDLKREVCEQVKRRPAAGLALASVATGVSKTFADIDRLDTISLAERRRLALTGISLGPPRPVSVAVKHATTPHEVTVQVMDTSTGLELRQAVAARLKLSDVADVKLVDCSDESTLCGCSMFRCTGEALAQPPAEQQPAPGRDLHVRVFLDRSLDISVEVVVPVGSTLSDVKKQLAASDPTGSTNPEDIGLSLPVQVNRNIKPLPNEWVLKAEHREFDVCEEAGPVVVTLTDVSDGSTMDVTVIKYSTILDLRRDLMQALGQMKMSSVRILRKDPDSDDLLEAVPNEDIITEPTSFYLRSFSAD